MSIHGSSHGNGSNGGKGKNGSKKKGPPNKLRVPSVTAKGKSKTVQNNLKPIPFKMKR